ncbi:HNH endonuclease signature motif containing protein [Haloechinothrix sp. LS1_15]|uniref:HNH endonuclease signature motif containing protein n=1 Tax=Haloechinothrix sp. LS1_15 TaxID=2652248 RepID=UPI0029448836|nr:HNH endonuclease signature motif containing protein [Haloechinothrix sp. LS1_15]MDV6012864.1 HNH endonuclease [Haloechinothrix sp. LS1_15]
MAVRDAECTAPGCHRPAHSCDFDHLTEWQHHGETSTANGGAKCQHHHTLKGVPGWSIHTDPAAGTTAITTPTGRTYTETRRRPEKPPDGSSTPDRPSSGPPDDDIPPF